MGISDVIPHRPRAGGLGVWQLSAATTANGSPWPRLGKRVGVVVLKPVSHRHRAGGEEFEVTLACPPHGVADGCTVRRWRRASGWVGVSGKRAGESRRRKETTSAICPHSAGTREGTPPAGQSPSHALTRSRRPRAAAAKNEKRGQPAAAASRYPGAGPGRVATHRQATRHMPPVSWVVIVPVPIPLSSARRTTASTSQRPTLFQAAQSYGAERRSLRVARRRGIGRGRADWPRKVSVRPGSPKKHPPVTNDPNTTTYVSETATPFS